MGASGTVLAGRYRLVQAIGRGGFGSVWEAEHVTLHSKVAIKFLLRTGAPDSDASQRFLREARLAAAVKHRNVLEITDFGFADTEVPESAVERGVPYMVMELLRGQNLAELLETEKRLSVSRTVQIVSDVLRGLGAVHDAGLVHRDIKPANVFLVRDEDGDFPKLVDFGLSRRAGRSDITSEGMLLGTPLYMSPEQALRGSDLDARVDIYAMGVVLFEMLAGRPPFDSANVAEVLRAIVTEPPPSLAALAPQAPPELVAVVEKAMSKERDDRFPDARAMRHALLAAVRGEGASTDRSTESLPRVRTEQAHADTLAAAPAVVISSQSARDESSSSARVESAGPKREGFFERAFRMLLLATLAAGVCVLLVDGPWSEWLAPAAPVSEPTLVAPPGDAAVPPLTQTASAPPETTVVPAVEDGDAALADAWVTPDAGTDAGALEEADAGADELDAGELDEEDDEALDEEDEEVDDEEEELDEEEEEGPDGGSVGPAGARTRPAHVRRPVRHTRRTVRHRPVRRRRIRRRRGR